MSTEEMSTEESDDDDNYVGHIILVHGNCHGAWCWYKVADLLRSAGFKVTVPDLAAAGIDSRTLKDLATFADYSEPLSTIMADLLPNEQVVLVSHSLGGFNIAMAMEAYPNKVSLAIFVSALLPDCTNGPYYIMDKYINEVLVNLDPMDNVVSEVEGSDGRTLTSILPGPKYLASTLYQLSPTQDITLASTLVRGGCIFEEDLKTLPALSKDRHGSVNKVFVRCLEDIQVPPHFQHWMIHNYPVNGVILLEEADHMSMMSMPNELSKTITQLFYRNLTGNLQLDLPQLKNPVLKLGGYGP